MDIRKIIIISVTAVFLILLGLVVVGEMYGGIKGDVPVRVALDLLDAREAGGGEVEANNGVVDVVDTSDWQVYRNSEFGFEFQYPSVYDQAVATNLSVRKSGIYEGISRIEYRDRIESLASFTFEEDTGIYPEFRMHVFDLDFYRFNNAPAGEEYGYYKERGQWWSNFAGNGAVDISFLTFVRGGVKGYGFGTGDGGFSVSLLTVPYEERDIMIELGFVSDSFTEEEVSREDIFSTFRFLE